MTNINVTLNELQIEELIHNVDIYNYVEYLTMDDWNDHMEGIPATEIIDRIDMNNFDTCDEYAVLDGLNKWVTADSLVDIFEPYLDEMLQEYLDNTLQ